MVTLPKHRLLSGRLPKNILKRETAFRARILHDFIALLHAPVEPRRLPGTRKQLRIVDGYFVIHVVLVGGRKPLGGVKSVAEIRYFARERLVLIEIGGIDNQRVTFPVA